MNIIWILHWIFPLSVLLLPFLPNKILKYIFWYPIIYILIWVCFDGCPLNFITPKDDYNTDSKNFIKPTIEKLINHKLSQTQTDCLLCLICNVIVVICVYKLIYKCKIK